MTLDPVVSLEPAANEPDVSEPDVAVTEPDAAQPDAAQVNTAEPEPVASTPDDGDAGPAPVPAPCSTFRSATREYELCSQPFTWSAAEVDCSLRGAELASVETDAENELIASAAVAVETNVWLSGTRDEALVWRWATGEIFWRGDNSGAVEEGAYAKWAPGEPNNDSTVSMDPERCLALTLGESDWNDRACIVELPYVCERPLQP